MHGRAEVVHEPRERQRAGAQSPADALLRLDDGHVETRLREHDRPDEAVRAGADDEGAAARLRRDAWTRAVEDAHRDAEPLALGADEVLRRDAAAVEEELARRRALDPELGLDPADLEARRPVLDDEAGDPLVARLGLG